MRLRAWLAPLTRLPRHRFPPRRNAAREPKEESGADHFCPNRGRVGLAARANAGTGRTAFPNRSLVSFAWRAFCCACLLLGGSSAWAEWNVSYDYRWYFADGTLKEQRTNWNVPPGGTGAGRIEVTAVFTWSSYSGGYGSSPLPPKLYVRLSGHAAAASAQSQGVVTANNGLGDATVDQPFGNGVARTSEGTHLIQSEHPNTQERFGPYTLTATATLGSSADMTFSAVEDTRGVLVRREGAVNEWFERDGTGHGDTTYSYTSYSTLSQAPAAPMINRQNFNSLLAGWPLLYNTIYDVDFWWSPDPNSSDTITSIYRDMPFGSVNHVDGGPEGSPTGPTTKVISLTVRDHNDGATATGKYVLTIHDEVENLSHATENRVASGPLWGSDPRQGGNALLIVWGYLEAGRYEAAQGHGSSSGWSLSADIDVLKWANDVFGMSISPGWSSERSSEFTGNAILPFDIPQGSYAYPMFQDTYIRHKFEWLHYTPAGEHRLRDMRDEPVPHKAVSDQYVGSSVRWKGPIDGTIPPPVYDPNVPPPGPEVP